MNERLWSFNDIKDATARFEAYRDSDDPVRHYFYGIALEMSGQADSADEKYLAFRAEAQRRFGDLGNGATHYAAEAERLKDSGDTKISDHYTNMARILRGPKPGARHDRNCVTM